MIDLKRNSKKIPVKALGLRKKVNSIYKPNQKEDFRISRSKFVNFLSCKRCFYLDRVKGLDAPGTPAWTLNETTDLLLKKEFDYCRENQIKHRLFKGKNLDNLVPFKHPEIDDWRNSLHKGVSRRFKNTNIILTGGIDDIWQNLSTKEIIIVDYKSQSKSGLIDANSYLNDPYHEGYKIQMDFYAYLFSGKDFLLSPISYFLVCNAKRDENKFDKKMYFDEYLIPYEWQTKWIDKQVCDMIKLLNQDEIPESNYACKNCAYSNQYLKLLS